MKLILRFYFFAAFTFAAFYTSAQDRFYHRLRMPATMVRNVYRSMPLNSYIIFNWNKIGTSNRYGLKGQVYTSAGDIVGNSFTLLIISPPPAKEFKNIAPFGFLKLDKNVMTANDMTGDTDAFFRPRKFKDDNELELDFVSYDVSSNAAGIAPIREFSLNPSPPR